MTSPYPDRPPLLTTLLQSFLIIPFWDLKTLFQMRRVSGIDLQHRLRSFFGALLMALLGWGALRWSLPGNCCRVSSILYPGETVGRLIWTRLMPTLGMLAFIALGGLIIIGLLVGLTTFSRRLPSLGIIGAVINALRPMVISLLASPPGHISILAVLLLGIRFGLLPVPAGHSVTGLLVPGFILALLPALIAARRVERAVRDPLIFPEQTIVLAATTFYRQASWLVGGLALAEALFGVDGLGKLLVDALRVGDSSLSLPLLLLSLFATASCRLHVIRLEMTALIPASNRLPDGSLLDDSGHWFKWVVLALILIVPLAFAFSGSPRPPLEPAALYAAPSAQYPWGTDGLGRDILTLGQLAIRHGWLIVLTGGLVSAGSGGLWSSGIMWLRNTRHHMLADGLRAPAEALILLAPAPLTLWFLLHLYAPASSPVAALGILTGIVLIPRMVWGMTRSKHVTLRPVSLLKRTGAHLAGAGFAALQMSFMAALIAGRGAAGLITPGGALAAYQDMIGGASLLNGGPYLRLALALALPGLALVWGWYLLADTLVDPQTVDGLADLLG